MASSDSSPLNESRNGSTPEPQLHREAELRPPRAAGIAPILAACTLAGILFGFGLRTMSQSWSHCDRSNSAATARNADVTWLGVEIRDARCSRAEGAIVLRVFPNSPAEAAGLQRGDVIVELRDRKVSSSSALVREVQALRPGVEAEIQVRRGSEMRTLRTQLSSIRKAALR